MTTAPTDGTRVLLRCLDRVVWIGRWCPQKVLGLACNDWHSDAGRLLEPDGWLPLPDVDECQPESEPMRPARRPISLVKFCREELGPTWSAVADRHLDESAPVTDANAAALAEMIGVSVDMIKAIDRNHRSWEPLLDTVELVREDRDR